MSERQLRCEHKLHGILTEEGIVSVKCKSSFCGAVRGVVVIHDFSTETGELVETRRFKDTPGGPEDQGKGSQHG